MSDEAEQEFRGIQTLIVDEADAVSLDNIGTIYAKYRDLYPQYRHEILEFVAGYAIQEITEATGIQLSLQAQEAVLDQVVGTIAADEDLSAIRDAIGNRFKPGGPSQG